MLDSRIHKRRFNGHEDPQHQNTMNKRGGHPIATSWSSSRSLVSALDGHFLAREASSSSLPWNQMSVDGPENDGKINDFFF